MEKAQEHRPCKFEYWAIVATLVLLSFYRSSAIAGVLTLEGPRTQGGLLMGRADPGSTVTVNGESVRVSPQGVFLVGFGRDAELLHDLRVRYPDRTTEARTIRIEPREYPIQRIDGLAPKHVTPAEQTLARIERENADVRAARSRNDARTDFLGGFIWPAQGRISGIYGSQRVLNGEPRRPHYGVDIAVPEGTPVVAPADGIVTLTHADMYYSGGTLIVDHGHGLSSSFLHLSRITVREGQRVRQGEKIAEVGSTGRSSGAHLDWRANLLEQRIDVQALAEQFPPRQ
jgi:murein DD-endopeptidase MepM/ murein hydrolase activator NlpD